MKNHARRLFLFFLTMCVACSITFSGIAAAKTYPVDQLSAEDMQLLKEAYGEIRSEYEQYFLPHFALDKKSSGLANGILEQRAVTLEWAHFVWTCFVTETIFNIQHDSADTYQLPEQEVFSALTSAELNQLMRDYAPIAQEAGLSSQDQFEVSFTELTGNGAVMLFDFKNTASPRASKYIGIAAEEDGSRHMYYAEPLAAVEDDPEMGGMFFCVEYIPDGDTNCWFIESTEAAFTESIHAALKGELEFAPMLDLVLPEELLN